jgi:hypothetical protein
MKKLNLTYDVFAKVDGSVTRTEKGMNIMVADDIAEKLLRGKKRFNEYRWVEKVIYYAESLKGNEYALGSVKKVVPANTGKGIAAER